MDERQTDGQAVVDWLRSEAATARTDLAYALGQLRRLDPSDRLTRALDALGRVGEALQGIETGGADTDGG